MLNLFFSLFLLSFQASASSFPSSFFFGLATAPAQIEDQLDDIWKAWGEKGKSKAFLNQVSPHDRLRFWTQPEVELDLATQSGISVYRFGVEWGRVMPRPHEFDLSVIKRYHEMMAMVKKRNLKIMLTLMHHSVPKWAQESGGWHQDEMQKHFVEFSQRMIQEFSKDVDYWLTFNEANVFVSLAYASNMWPPGENLGFTSLLEIGPWRGKALKAMDRMTDAHNEVYSWAHQQYPNIKIGIAHNMAYYTSKSWLGKISASQIDRMMNWRFPERIKKHMDFFGFNYYGAEWIKGATIDIDPVEEYSEAGRAIYPQGLYYILKQIDERFKGLPIIITENGIADALDILRPAYIIEHLEAIEKAMKENVPVIGYIYWTLSDNMEWSDGYCPKFGFFGVERSNNFKRVARPSFELYRTIATTKMVTQEMRDLSWLLVQKSINLERPFCRADDGVTALDEPKKRRIVKKDWRFSLEK